MGDQALFIGGGAGHDNNKCDTAVKKYDLSEDSVTSKTACTYARGYGFSGSAGAYIDIYAFGNQDAPNLKSEKWSVSGESWSAMTDLPRNQVGGSNCPVIVSHIYLSNVKYDCINNVWKGWMGTRVDMQGSRGQIGNTIVGVQDNGDAQKYAPDDDIYTDITDCPDTSGMGMGNGWGDNTYAWICAGVYGPAGGKHWRYELAGNSWTSRSAKPGGKDKGGSFYIEGLGHSFCGKIDGSDYDSPYHGRFNDSDNSWTSKASPGDRRDVLGANPLSNLPPNAPANLSVSTT